MRYFNPVDTHSSALIGENPLWTPNNLTPHIFKVALDNLLFQKGAQNYWAAINAFNQKIYMGFGLGREPEVWEIQQVRDYVAKHPNIKILGDARSLISSQSPYESMDDFASAVRLGEYVIHHQKNIQSYDWKSLSPLYLRSLKTEERQGH